MSSRPIVLVAGGAGKNSSSFKSGKKATTTKKTITPNKPDEVKTTAEVVAVEDLLSGEEVTATAVVPDVISGSSSHPVATQKHDGVGDFWNPEEGERQENIDLLRNDNNNNSEDVVTNKNNRSSRSSGSGGMNDYFWLVLCFSGIMVSFVCYGLMLEYATSGDNELHELSFLFVTSLLYTMTAAAGRYVRDEKLTAIPPKRFAILGMTSMGSSFCSVRSLRYVIYPIQVLAKSCKPVPVMIMGAFMGKYYPPKKYLNVILIVAGVGMFMSGGQNKKKAAPKIETTEEETSVETASQLFGIILLSISLCFDGGTGAYEDKLMSVHSVEPFDLMYNIQLGKTIIAGVGLLIFNQMHHFLQMCQDIGFILVGLGLSGAVGQVFIFVTIAKFGALTCSIIGLARKVTTIVASIYFYGHALNPVQSTGLAICVIAMVMNFWGKKKNNNDGHGQNHASKNSSPEKQEQQLEENEPLYSDYVDKKNSQGLEIELGPVNTNNQSSNT